MHRSERRRFEKLGSKSAGAMRGISVVGLFVGALVTVTQAQAQDVRGVEICTAEKQMERRTSCLQANIDFLQNAMDRNARDARLKIDNATKELVAARNELSAMKAALSALQARLDKLERTDKLAPEKNEKTDAQKK